MSAVCRFCGQAFANAQGVRAHLKSCAAYQARRGNAPLPKASLWDHRHGLNGLGNEEGLDPAPVSVRLPEEGPLDPVQHLGQRLAAERINLQLREVEEAGDELDRRKEAKERERQQQAEQKAAAERMAARDRENAQRLAEENRRAREHREAAERQRQRQRRDIIQSIKDQVLERWFAPVHGRSDLKARALQEIEGKISLIEDGDSVIGNLVRELKSLFRFEYSGHGDVAERSLALDPLPCSVLFPDRVGATLYAGGPFSGSKSRVTGRF